MKQVNFFLKKAKSNKKTIMDLCSKTTQSYEYGLKLIQENTGQNSFDFGVDVVKNPKASLEKMIKSSYSEQSTWVHAKTYITFSKKINTKVKLSTFFSFKPLREKKFTSSNYSFY